MFYNRLVSHLCYHPIMIERVLVVKSDWVHSLHREKGFIRDIHPDFL